MSAKTKFEREKLLKKIAEKRAQLENRSDIKVKIPKVSLPADYNIHSQPLFSLPPELMRPTLASGYPGYKRKLALAKKKGTFFLWLVQTTVASKASLLVRLPL